MCVQHGGANLNAHAHTYAEADRHIHAHCDRDAYQRPSTHLYPNRNARTLCDSVGDHDRNRITTLHLAHRLARQPRHG